MQMGQTRSGPRKDGFFAESRHFFAVLLDVTLEKITQSRLKRPFEGAMFSYEDVAKAVCFGWLFYESGFTFL